MPPWILVTPASRGIGLALARRLLRTTELPVVATTRGSVEQTREAVLRAGRNEGSNNGKDNGVESAQGERLHVMKLDFRDEDSIASAASKCRDLFPTSSKDKDNFPSHLHLSLVLPGILHPEKSPSQLDLVKITETFQMNTISHLLMLKHFSSFLPRKSNYSLSASASWAHGLPNTHATWATMSARVGSIGDNSLGGWYSYRASKAAVNQITKTFDNYLKTAAADKAIAVSLHPGTVRTGLSKEFWGNVKEGKLFTPEFAAESLLAVLEGMKEKGRGKCWDWAGKEVPP